MTRINGTPKPIADKEQALSVDGDRLLINCCHDVEVTETGIAITLELEGASRQVRLYREDYSAESWSRLVQIAIDKLIDLRREAHLQQLEHHKKFLQMFNGKGE